MSRWLSFTGAMLVLLGLAAHVFGWDVLLSVPRAAINAVQEAPGTYGVVAFGIVLMVAARLIGRRGG